MCLDSETFNHLVPYRWLHWSDGRMNKEHCEAFQTFVQNKFTAKGVGSKMLTQPKGCTNYSLPEWSCSGQDAHFQF